MAKQKSKSASSTITLNKKARHDYFIEDEIEVGIVGPVRVVEVEGDLDQLALDQLRQRYACGQLLVTFAAPVLVGICDIVPERARRSSLWNTSVSTWSFV